jgi:glycosyltransferase involved in cell wall biosynthesis
MLDGFARLSKARRNVLLIIGEGEERAPLEALIKKLGLEHDAALLGFVKDGASYLKAFDAFALTSVKEGLPYVVIEAGFAGIPVVATNVGGVKEVVEDMQSGVLVQTRKPDDIAQGLELIKNNADKSRGFAENIQKRAKTEFSLAKMVEKTIDIYGSTQL